LDEERTAVDFHGSAGGESVAKLVVFTNDDHGHYRRQGPVFGGSQTLLVLVEEDEPIGMFYEQESVERLRRCRYTNDEKKARDEKRGPSLSDGSNQCSGASRHLLIVESWDATPYRSMLVLSNCELKYASDGTEKSHAPNPRLCSS
jgi:hypothetical protein